MNDDIPTAKPGDKISLQAAPRPVMACGMGEEADEVQVMGLIPNAADGARVAVGAGLRNKANGIQMTLCALLDPKQAMEAAAMLSSLAVQAAMLRGEILMPDLPNSGPLLQGDLDMDQARAMADRIPGQAVADDEGCICGRPRMGFAVHAIVQHRPGDEEGIIGTIAAGTMTEPDAREIVCIHMRRGDQPDDDGATAALSLSAAVSFSEALTDALIQAAEREQAIKGKAS